MNRVTFPPGIAGLVHHPEGFDPSKKYAAIVCVHPGSSVKEQTAGLYAQHMAEHGFVALAFDAFHQGESAGEPRFLEDPSRRVEDIRCAVDFLTTLGYVDDQRIGVLGVCAGGGYAVNAALTERRIQAVGTVVGVNIGRANRDGDVERTLAEVARQRTADARSGDPTVAPWIPSSPEEAARAGLTELDLTEAVAYYRTPRGQHPRSSNQLLSRSTGGLMAFDAFHLVETLLVQPLQVIVGNEIGAFGSYRDGFELYRRARCDKDLLVIDGASHYDLYDRPAYVGQAVAKLAAFYEEKLVTRGRAD